jgi:hypothetical protein
MDVQKIAVVAAGVLLALLIDRVVGVSRLLAAA